MKQIITYISIGLLLVGCGKNTTSEDKNNKKNETVIVDAHKEDSYITLTKNQFTDAKIELGKITEQSFEELVKVSGKIDVPPKNKASVSVPMGGYIKNTSLLVGDTVKRGQALVTIENPEFVTIQQNYLEVSKQLNYLKSEYERQKTMLTENITSKKNYLKAESEYETAQARYNGLQKQLQLLNFSPQRVASGKISSITTVFSPISGVVSKVNIVKGTYVSPATEILHIIDNNHIHVELTVFEKDVMKLKKGQPIRFTLPENSKAIFDAEIHLIGASINKNRTVDVHGHLKDKDKHHFLTGMFVDANIVVNSHTQKALPKDAVIEVDEHFYVLKLIEEKNGEYIFEKTHIEIGKTNANFTEIKNVSDFTTSDVFVTQGAFNLLNDSEGGHGH